MVYGVRFQTIQFEQSTLYGYVTDKVESVQLSNRRYGLFLLSFPTWFRSERRIKPWFYYERTQIHLTEIMQSDRITFVQLKTINKVSSTFFK